MKRDLWTWVGIWIVGVTAAIWSFTSLSALAELVGITATIPLLVVTVHISWGLPLTVDVLAAVATRVWLRGEAPEDAVDYARRAAWVAIGASVAGNAYHGWLSGGRIDTVIISAVPAVVIGTLVHLAVLVGRPVTAQQAEDPPEPLMWGVNENGEAELRRWERPGRNLTSPPLAHLDKPGGLFDRRDALDTSRDAAIIADLRALESARGRRWVRDEVKAMYGIGSSRAERVLMFMGWMPRAEPGDERADA